MIKLSNIVLFLVTILVLVAVYLEPQQETCAGATIRERFEPPSGFARISVEKGSFAEWLRNLPLKDGCPPVKLYNGKFKANQNIHIAVVDLDIGEGDLQQCADAIIRLRAEFLWKNKLSDELHFDFTNDERSSWLKWSEGWRPIVEGNFVKWVKSASKGISYNNFRSWLTNVFMYAGTISLERELLKVDPLELQIGDVFIQGGNPGHAVIAVDLAEQKTTGEKVFLLAQSYMPAQDIHILKNPMSEELSPWYSAKFRRVLITPEWRFKPEHLHRFADP